MNDPKYLLLISKHLSDAATPEENEVLHRWLNEDVANLVLFENLKDEWGVPKKSKNLILSKFTKKNISDILIQHVIGNVIGFAIGMWVTNAFTHYTVERRSAKNLFGLAGRKKILVNETPEWVQYCLSFILGFIALELINYFFQTKKYLVVWAFIKKVTNSNKA